jgi:hypothetical protein
MVMDIFSDWYVWLQDSYLIYENENIVYDLLILKILIL